MSEAITDYMAANVKSRRNVLDFLRTGSGAIDPRYFRRSALSIIAGVTVFSQDLHGAADVIRLRVSADLAP
jgi:hypothetical protein